MIAGDTPALRLSGVSKRYGRRGAQALDDLTMAVPRGSITGLVGPNGAGKTTLFSVVSGFLPPDSGTVDILGEGPFDPWRLKGRIGVLPQDATLEPRDTCADFLEFMGQLQGMTRAGAMHASAKVLARVDLTARADVRVAHLSHGMRRRLSTASALLGDPELILLDEPMAGLDPEQAQRLREVLVDCRGRQTLVVSSHNLDELERICDHVVFMSEGRCVRAGSLEEIRAGALVVRWSLSARPDLEALGELLPDHRFDWLGVDEGVLLQSAAIDADLDASAVVVAGALARAEIAIRQVRRGTSLEEAFLSLR